MFKRIFDKNDLDLLKFRMNAIEEAGGDKNDSEIEYTHSQLLKKYSSNKKVEDIFRYTKKKWLSTNFDHIDTFWINGEISCISGSVIYNNWIKGAVYHYNLKKYSVYNRTLFFRDDGMLDRLIDYAKEKSLDGVFISIYPHNYKLQALVKRMKEHKSIPTTGNLSKIRSLKYYGLNPINGVDQDIFYYSFGDKFDESVLY